jgi:uncharacterized OsmC-like protein
MKITLLSDESLRLEPIEGPMTIEAMSADQQYSPFHMLGSALAFCTFSVLHAWASHAKIGTDKLAIDVSWSFAENPHRVGEVRLSFAWPELPPSRLNAAKRAAELCTVHATLMHPPAIRIDGTIGDGATRAGGTQPGSVGGAAAAGVAGAAGGAAR